METETFCEDCGCNVSSENLCQHYVILENDAEIGELSTTVIFEEQLISFVQDAPALWDSRLPIVDRSKIIKDKLWLEIYDAFHGKYAIKTLQAKWKNLRDTFIKTKGEIESYVPSGSGAKPTEKVWRFYDTMSFLKDSISPRATTSNVKVTTPATSNESTRSSVETPLVSPLHENGSILSAVKKKTCNIDEAFLGATEKLSTPPIKHMNPICVRLSEMLSNLPPRKKAKVEIQLLTVATEAIYDEDNN